MLSSLKLYAYAALALAIVGLFIHDRWMAKRYEHQKAATETLTATLNAERENTRKAHAASAAYQTAIAELQAARAAIPTRSVRLCVSAAVPGPSAAPAGADDANPQGLQEATRPYPQVGRDIGRELFDLADEADLCPAKLKALQDWVRAR